MPLSELTAIAVDLSEEDRGELLTFLTVHGNTSHRYVCSVDRAKFPSSANRNPEISMSIREIAGETKVSIKRKMSFVLCALAALWFSVLSAVAQSSVELSHERFLELYAQSQVLDEALADWRPLAADIRPLHDTPFDIPVRTKPPRPDELGRAARGALPSAAVKPVVKPKSDLSIHWMPALMESLYYTGVMHAFRTVTEPGTRDTLNGHWFQNYKQSLAELRGWSDGDSFMAPYVGHSIEGSVFGYILRQNDPRYRNVQWGDGRDYFISVLRSMAFSAVWHTQWKIGPLSEASYGNVMLHASPGFVTLTDTPTLGAATMIAEDVADRYLIMGLENRTGNRTLIILTRSFLNPGRSFANIMAFRVPWNRDTRIGLFGAAGEIRREMLLDYKAGLGPKPFTFQRRSTSDQGLEFRHTYPKAAPIELAAFPVYESFLGGGSCIGGGGSGAARVSPALQVVTEVSGCQMLHMPRSNQSGDSLFYGGGLRWTPRAAQKFSPYVEMLFGGRKVTFETDDGALKKKLMKEWNDGSGTSRHYPKRSDWSVEVANNGPSIAVGGGVDVVMTRAFAWRLVSVQYTHTWMGDVDMIRPQDGVRVTTQAVLRIGTW